MQTLGLSPKAVLAAVFPALTTLLVALANGAFTGFDKHELQLAAVGLVTSALAFLGAYVGAPGLVTAPPAPVVAEDGPPVSAA